LAKLKKLKLDQVHRNSETEVHPCLKNYIGFCMYKSSMRLRSRLNEALLPFDIVTHHFGLLGVIWRTGPISQNKVGQGMDIDKTTMVKLLDHLEQKKLITRVSDKTDRRVKLLKATDKGIKLHGQLDEIRLRVEQEFLAVLTADERIQLKTIVSKLVQQTTQETLLP
jgi:DNA-binding MarR family transcriptional regulator